MVLARSLIGVAAVATVVLVLSVTGCGSGTATDGPAAIVGSHAIGVGTLDHWMDVLAGGHLPASGTTRYDSLRARALNYLISTDWLIGEAEDRGIPSSVAVVSARTRRKERMASPGGVAELESYLEATGERETDIKLEAEAELAHEGLKKLALRGAAPVSDARVASYFVGHRQQFVIAKHWLMRMTNRKTSAEAMQVKRAVESGKSFAALSERQTLVAGHPISDGQSPLLEAEIKRAKPGMLIGPVKQRVDYLVFEVERIVPAKQRKLSEVEAQIRRQLLVEARSRALAELNRSWRSKWKAMTSCGAGYVSPACRQYHGTQPLDPEFEIDR